MEAQIRGRMPTLDGLRGVAIVRADHHSPWVQWVYEGARSGWVGVDLFFVLSGFLITGILIDTRERSGYFGSFYARRFLRIFPLYYGTLAVVFFVLPAIDALDTDGFRDVAAIQQWLWLYLSNWVSAFAGDLLFVGDWVEANHFWSLAAEEQFYLAWPLLVYAVAPRSLGPLCAGIVVLSFAVKAAVGFSDVQMHVVRADGLVVGAVVAVLVRSPAGRAAALRFAPWIAAVAFAGLAAVFVAAHGLRQTDPLMNRFGVSLAQLLAAATIVILLAQPARSLLYRVATSAPLSAFGRYSYGIYIFHWLFNPLMLRYAIPHLLGEQPTGNSVIDEALLFAQRSALAFGLAWLSFQLFEKRFLDLKKRFVPGAVAR
jgi:peptidoglycan/LPS O-acetylase OafA/YrhL